MKVNLFSRHGHEMNYKMMNNGKPTFVWEVSEVFFCENHLYVKVSSPEEANSVKEDIERFAENNQHTTPFVEIEVAKCDNGTADLSIMILPSVRWSITD